MRDMIQIEILSSPDPNVIGPILYHPNLIRIGRSQGDVLVDDPELSPIHYCISIDSEGKVTGERTRRIDHVLLNQKRVEEESIYLYPGDVLTLGNTQVKFIKGIFRPNPISISDLKKHYELFFSDGASGEHQMDQETLEQYRNLITQLSKSD